jgi:hypothetical protein
VESVSNENTTGQTIDIGSPNILTYKQMMLGVAKELNLKRWIFPVPVLTPKLSSYWMNLITPIPVGLARSLIESLRSETVCENQKGAELFSFHPAGFAETVRRALEKTQAGDVETKWTAASAPYVESEIDPSHLLTDKQVVQMAVPPERVFRVICSLGGENGWFYANWLWRLRGFLDKQIGGVGLRRGRRHAMELASGEALDFWRVEEVEPGRRLLLRAEMKLPGKAWLEYVLESADASRTTLIQTARYYPKGLLGLFYWFALYPMHRVIFRGLSRSIVVRALQSGTPQDASGMLLRTQKLKS